MKFNNNKCNNNKNNNKINTLIQNKPKPQNFLQNKIHIKFINIHLRKKLFF